jgi:hypothetical protein
MFCAFNCYKKIKIYYNNYPVHKRFYQQTKKNYLILISSHKVREKKPSSSIHCLNKQKRSFSPLSQAKHSSNELFLLKQLKTHKAFKINTSTFIIS